jgi:uncharacterized small protein (DUF1192 family)
MQRRLATKAGGTLSQTLGEARYVDGMRAEIGQLQAEVKRLKQELASRPAAPLTPANKSVKPVLTANQRKAKRKAYMRDLMRRKRAKAKA